MLHSLWWRHARVPLVIFLVCAVVFSTTSADLAIARALFFDDAQMQWIGRDNWWTNEFLHTGGRWFVRACVAVALAIWVSSFTSERLRVWRRHSGYFVMAVVLSVALTGLLKVLTNVDCPWDLQQFGGKFPFVHLFADRPDGLRTASCFPAAHASSGYALLALFFVLRDSFPKWRTAGLCVGVVMGLVFGLAQQSRGAHFLSHDIWSAFIVWIVALSVYVYAFGGELRSGEQSATREAYVVSSRAQARL
ncbi:MAG: phosphatase PAP2 family protein [Steroidobacter sp.]